MMDTREFVVRKLFSARFWMAISVTFTACFCVIIGRIPVGAFMGIAGAIIHAYFSVDRAEEKKQVTETTQSISTKEPTLAP